MQLLLINTYENLVNIAEMCLQICQLKMEIQRGENKKLCSTKEKENKVG